MTNRFFATGFNPNPTSTARSPSVKAELQAIEAAFASVQAELDSILGRGTGFQSLANVPAAIAALKYLRGNAAGTALEFVSAGSVGVKSLTSTAYTLAALDAGQLLVMDNTAAITVTVPTAASLGASTFDVGATVCLKQHNQGQVTIAPAAGVTVYSSDNLMKTRGQHAQVALIYLGGDAWQLIGERNAASLGFASLLAPNVFSGLQSVPFVALTDAASIAVNAALGNNFRVVLGGNRTLANPTNLADGAVINIRVKQDATGGRTLSYGSMWKWPGGSAPTLSTAANAIDFICAQYDADAGILICNMLKAFA